MAAKMTAATVMQMNTTQYMLCAVKNLRSVGCPQHLPMPIRHLKHNGRCANGLLRTMPAVPMAHTPGASPILYTISAGSHESTVAVWRVAAYQRSAGQSGACSDSPDATAGEVFDKVG